MCMCGGVGEVGLIAAVIAFLAWCRKLSNVSKKDVVSEEN